MIEKNPTQSAMDKILQGEVKQIPRWHFVVKNIVLWFVGFLCIVAGALTVSLVIFTFANSAFVLRDISKHNFFQHIMIVLPLLWIIVTILFAALFDIFVRHTKKGYKYSLWLIILVNMFLSVIVGIAFYFFGISHIVDDMMNAHFRSYHSVEKRQAQLFNNPGKGVIIGHVTKCGDEYFTLVTSDNTQWHVIREHIIEFKQNKISDGQRFVVIGKVIDQGIFVACDIRMRGMSGSNRQLQRKRMEQVHKNNFADVDSHKIRFGQMPQNMDVMIQEACVHVQ